MLLTEILEDPLKELELQMMLRSTDSHVSQAQAEKTLIFFRNAQKELSGAQTGPISFCLDKKFGTLRIIGTSLPTGWRSGPAAMSRLKIMRTLSSYGFKVAVWPSQARDRIDVFSLEPRERNNGPHIYFW